MATFPPKLPKENEFSTLTHFLPKLKETFLANENIKKLVSSLEKYMNWEDPNRGLEEGEIISNMGL